MKEKIYTTKRSLIVVFLFALIIRGIVFFQVLDHPEVILQPDSSSYVSLAQGLIKYGTLCLVDEPTNPDVERMPGYPVFVSAILRLFQGSLLAVIIVQIIVDAMSCVIICRLGDLLWDGIGLLCGILACLNLGMITYSQFILTDSLFLFVFMVSLILVFKIVDKGKWKHSVALGAAIGIASMIRPVVIYLPTLMMPLLLVFLILKRGAKPVMAALKVSLIAIMFLITISPWMMRNYIHYGHFAMMSQSGVHSLEYIVPFVWQYSKGIPFIEGMELAEISYKEELKKKGLNQMDLGPFEESRLKRNMAINYLRNESKIAIAKAWGFGIAKNLFSPAIIDLSYLLNIERPHFFSTKGTTFFERAWNFFVSIKGPFGFAVMGSLGILLISRVLQMWGFILLVRRDIWKGIFCFCLVSYFLIISGPVGYAKYRLPFEPILIILMAIGIKSLIESLTRFYTTRLRRLGKRSGIMITVNNL